MENTILQQIGNLKDETAERTDAIKEDVFDALTRHGITHITDDDIEVYSGFIMDDDEILIVAKADFDPATKELKLEEQDRDYHYRDAVNYSHLRNTDAKTAVLEWLANILRGIDKGEFRVIDGAVKPFVFRPGDKVRWNDPGIMDFAPEERQSQAERIYTVTRASEDIVCFSDDTSDVEAPPREVVLVEACPKQSAKPHT